MPYRAIGLENVDLSKYDCSSVEHVPNLYRIYKNGSGIFKNNQLVYSSISKEREKTDFQYLMTFNENEYEKSISDYNSFWEWMSCKNDNRWVDFSNKSFDYDRKNMMHLIRLLMEAENIIKEGKPKVRFYNEERQYLLDVRNGKFTYEQLTNSLEDKINLLKDQFDKSSLPYGVDMKKLNSLYIKLMNY